jgi:hypothetical protein
MPESNPILSTLFKGLDDFLVFFQAQVTITYGKLDKTRVVLDDLTDFAQGVSK